MLFTAGIEAALKARNRSIITHLDLDLLVQDLLAKGQWGGERLKRMPASWDAARMRAMASRLVGRQALDDDGDFESGVYRVLGADQQESAEEVACLADPFCYVSHASAMRLHGLLAEARPPLHLSTPENRLWRGRWASLNERLGPDAEGMRPSYPRPRFGPRLRRQDLAVHETTAPADIVEIGRVRVATLGETFAEMLAEPALCGGMPLVLEVWAKHALAHLEVIVEAIDRRDSKILKVRAGHIFTERLGVETPEIRAWQAFAQRGGSRKLDPERPYAPTFSARWMLSLNLPEQERSGTDTI